MKIDQTKLRKLIVGSVPPPSPDALRRELNVFFVGGNLPERETLETLFESHFQCNAALFHLTFGDLDHFNSGEQLARTIKKNFNARVVGRFDCAPPSHLIERAYAAGVDILDLPLALCDRTLCKEHGYAIDERLQALEFARTVFPRWSVVSTLTAGEEPASSTLAGIDALLAADVLPLVTISGRAALLPQEDISAIFAHLNDGWRRQKAAIKPLLPLIYLSTPLVSASSRGVVRSFIDIIDDRRHLAASDLRRLLRVKEVEESYESSGL